jgi:hypothetical protein
MAIISWSRKKLGKSWSSQSIHHSYSFSLILIFLAALLTPVFQHMLKYLENQYHDHGSIPYYICRSQLNPSQQLLVKSEFEAFRWLIPFAQTLLKIFRIDRYLKKNILNLDLKELGTNFQAVYMDPPLLLPGEEPSPGKITIEQLVSLISRNGLQ